MSIISVIIPVYNGENTIQETIQSVLNQTFDDFELIVIDDGSTDSTLKVIQSIPDSRIRVFSYPNAGLATSRNRGLEKATGEYIAFLDADDLWTPDKLEAQLKALQENPKAAVAYSWTDMIDESGQFLRPDSRASFTGNVYEKILLTCFLSNGSNPLIRKQALTEVGDFNESLTSAEDWEMWIRLAARYEFVAIPVPQILYRQLFSSMSFKILKQETGILEVINGAFSEVYESLQYLKSRSLANAYKFLTFKVLEAPVIQQTGIIAAQFFWRAIQYDPQLLKAKVTGKVLCKIALLFILPPQQAQKLFERRKTLFNTSTLLGYIKLDA